MISNYSKYLIQFMSVWLKRIVSKKKIQLMKLQNLIIFVLANQFAHFKFCGIKHNKSQVPSVGM